MHGRLFLEDENNVTDAPADDVRETGCITTWFHDKGWGWVLSNTVTDHMRRSLFLHIYNYEGSPDILRVGLRVSFERAVNAKGPRAVKVRSP